MYTNNNLTQRNYELFIGYAHDYSNTANSLFWNLKKFGKEFKLKFFLDEESLLLGLGQYGLEVIQNVIKESKYFILLLPKKAIEKIPMYKKNYRQNGKNVMKSSSEMN